MRHWVTKLREAIRGEKHRFQHLGAEQKEKFEQKGLREFLLCGDCETKRSVWENHAKELMEPGSPLVYKSLRSDVQKISGFDYPEFKLFQLSTLWMAGISSLPFFSHVTLGVHEERIRDMLFRSDPGEPYEYGCSMWATRLAGERSDLVVQPGRVKKRLLNRVAYRFTFGGYKWIYFVSTLPPKTPEERVVFEQGGVLQKEGYFFVGTEDLENEPSLRGLVRRL